METYGRNRESIVDIEEKLHKLFSDHPKSYISNEGVSVIPGDNLVDILRLFAADSFELMTPDEVELLNGVVAANPGLEVTAQLLLGFIADRTKAGSPPQSPTEEQPDSPSGRGRTEDREVYDNHSRSSSSDSIGTSVYRGPGSRPPSRGPQTPTSGSSVFDTERRQRSTPLGANAPSSWTKRPPAPHRRKSDAGSRSDSEYSASPGAFSRPKAQGRTRTPSNPTSPSFTMSPELDSFSPIGSPQFPDHSSRSHSRPHSRAQSQPQSHFNNHPYNRYGSPTDDRDYSSPDDNDHNDETFVRSISSLPMPRGGSDSDSDDDDSALGLVMDRSAASSTVSMEPIERLEALQRINADLGRKLVDAEKTLQRKLSEHDAEVEDMQGRLEEMRSELSATKREEKELRSKERQNMTQIGALETEIAKITKALDHARTTYSSLQRQYQEQCSLSEKYRDDLRIREENIRNLKEQAVLSELEREKWNKEQQIHEERVAHIEEELSIAQQAHAQLDEQKQENLMLKETIDRMRFDMDEMRNSAIANVAGGPASGQSSRAGTMSKSLGAELMGKMKGGWGMEDEEAEEGEESGSAASTPDAEGGSDDTEGEDVIQTIITRKKRKVASRANKIETRTFEEIKEYSDSSTQYEKDEFSSTSATQTDPEPKVLTASIIIQTDDLPIPEPEPIPVPRVTMDMEIQTDHIEPEISRSPSPIETMASSSSTILPPTPKAKTQPLEQLSPHDQPPAYSAEQEVEQEWRVAAETLKKWHHGVKIPFEPVAGGISEEAIEEWKALKEELGVDCMVIDKIVANSERIGRSPKDDDSRPRRGRFYNIYNTYVYGANKNASTLPATVATQAALVMGVSAFFIFALGPYMVPHYSVPGGPTYYDRAAWNSFNSMQAAGEGFSPDGTAAVWNFLGRVGGGAARIARGWPT